MITLFCIGVARLQWGNLLMPEVNATILQIIYSLAFSWIWIWCTLIQISMKFVPIIQSTIYLRSMTPNVATMYASLSKSCEFASGEYVICLCYHSSIPWDRKGGWTLQWSHKTYTGRDGVSNHQPHDCLLNRLYKAPASLAFVWGIHRWPVNSPHKGPVTRKMFHLMT